MKPASTRMWVSVLLGQLQGNMGDLHPERFERKPGTFDSQEERMYLRETIERILHQLEEARNLV